ncbi:MAG: hypothetical protein ACO3S4_01135 [Pseudohongiellaceae bacterium]
MPTLPAGLLLKQDEQTVLVSTQLRRPATIRQAGAEPHDRQSSRQIRLQSAVRIGYFEPSPIVNVQQGE